MAGRQGPPPASDAEAEGPSPLMARQPVFDRANRVAGYELLYRGAPPAPGEQEEWAERATSSVLIDLVSGAELDSLLGQQRAFINLPRSFLFDFPAASLAPERFVLEVLEDVEADAGIFEALRELKASGYTLALDDFVLFGGHQKLLGLADLVKVDIQGYDQAGLADCVRELRRHPVHLLAEKVETPEERARCRELGFHYFQGFFFARPQPISRSRLSADRVNALQLVGRLQDPELDLEGLTELISQDVYLSYRILRLINSAFFPLRTRIDSVQRALVYLGLDTVRTWATWLAMAGVRDKPQELAITNLVRARMAASLGEALEGGGSERYFTAGLFSTLDALLDRPMAEALEQLPLSAELEAALLRHEGSVGQVLAAIKAYERGDWDGAARAGLAPEWLGKAYQEGVAGAEEVRSLMA